MIECYYKWCKNHCYHHNGDEGPFCNNNECTATNEQIVEFRALRAKEFYNENPNNHTGEGRQIQ